MTYDEPLQHTAKLRPAKGSEKQEVSSSGAWVRGSRFPRGPPPPEVPVGFAGEESWSELAKTPAKPWLASTKVAARSRCMVSSRFTLRTCRKGHDKRFHSHACLLPALQSYVYREIRLWNVQTYVYCECLGLKGRHGHWQLYPLSAL